MSPSSEKCWPRRKWDAFFLEPDEKRQFSETRSELIELLKTADDELATEILDEAKDAHARLEGRIAGAERRASTLQGASAIAAGLTLTGSGLLLDATKFQGLAWRMALGALLAYTALAFVLSAYRARLATSRVHRWRAPPDRLVLSWREGTVASARIARAAEILLTVDSSQGIARWKIAMMRASAEWLSRALAGLLAVMLLATAYAFLGPSSNDVSRGTEPSSVCLAGVLPPSTLTTVISPDAACQGNRQAEAP